ncbi:DUF4145 domain-containing protein [Sporosarcina koreensis]|uniref:DUF4145 domain-containing protein n=1 Tax=Sporosarcina koreensis TaxID=334735 RepID=UPI0015CF2CF3|nr:DUF4145 domain-containing protein [Sporosarcina koreensis]
MLKTVMPDIRQRSYRCPRCGVLCPQDHFKIGWNSLPDSEIYFKKQKHKMNPGNRVLIGGNHFIKEPAPLPWDLFVSVCTECEKYTIWENEKVIFPPTSEMPEPEEYMPEDVKRIYEEAAQVFQYSPRASAALLRLAIETLLIQHLGLKKDSINNMIGDLVTRGTLSHVQQALDALRFYGNKGIHFGEIDLNDDQEKVQFLFILINMLVKELISKPIEINSIYEALPESFRQSVENRDAVKK